MIRIITIGKKHESWIAEGIERYQKRLKAPWNVEWQLLPHSSLEGPGARQEETERILSKLSTNQFVVLLDEVGSQYNSPSLASMFETQFVSGKDVVLVIGGAYGVTPELHRRANLIWSLSSLVFPHQLVRLILIEQLYRCQSIASGGKYHHE